MRKQLRKIFAAVLLVLGLSGVAFADGEWIRELPVWFKRAVYTGTSKVQLTNTTGNLSTTTGTFSGAVTTGALSSTTIAASSSATFSAPIRLASAVTGVTAATGGDQAAGNKIPLTASLYSVGTVGSSGDSVTLPTGAPLGHTVLVENRAATNTLDLFPGASGAINNKAGDAVLNVLAGKAYLCASLTAGAAATNWMCVGP